MTKLMLALLGCICAIAQTAEPPNRPSPKAFAGTWKGTCAEGKDFVIVTLAHTEAGNWEGAVQLANMRGGEDGQCVVDPPSERHALKISDARLQGAVLSFRGSSRMEFEMTLPAPAKARLKFLGTASEDSPWELQRTR